jgi:hypothetical protein
MARQPSAEGPATASKYEAALGIWGVAKAGSGHPVTYSPPAPCSRVKHDIIPVYDNGRPRTAPRLAAADDHEPVLPSPGSWPRVFPGL